VGKTERELAGLAKHYWEVWSDQDRTDMGAVNIIRQQRIFLENMKFVLSSTTAEAS
jgi:hypothetical protein